MVSAGNLAFFLAKKRHSGRHVIGALAALLAHIKLGSREHQIAEIDDADLPSCKIEEVPPVEVVKSVALDAGKSFIIAEAIAAEHLELVNEQSLRRRLTGAVLSLPFQNQQGDVDTETAPFVFRRS